MAEAGGVRMPAEQMGAVALDELVLHGWDLARATGQPFPCDPASTAAVLEFTTVSAQPEHAGHREGLFGPVVESRTDAPAFDRALGFAGRDPAWTPRTIEHAPRTGMAEFRETVTIDAPRRRRRRGAARRRALAVLDRVGVAGDPARFGAARGR